MIVSFIMDKENTLARVSISDEDAPKGGNVAVRRELFLPLSYLTSHIQNKGEPDDD